MKTKEISLREFLKQMKEMNYDSFKRYRKGELEIFKFVRDE